VWRSIDGGSGGQRVCPLSGFRPAARWRGREAQFTCPYDWAGYCKHIVAVLLKFANQTTHIIERKPFAKLLRGLDHPRPIELLEKQAESDPELAAWIEAR
jgi:uncharacterized Zn finger protein